MLTGNQYDIYLSSDILFTNERIFFAMIWYSEWSKSIFESTTAKWSLIYQIRIYLVVSSGDREHRNGGIEHIRRKEWVSD